MGRPQILLYSGRLQIRVTRVTIVHLCSRCPFRVTFSIMSLEAFHPIIQRRFQGRFSRPDRTSARRLALDRRGEAHADRRTDRQREDADGVSGRDRSAAQAGESTATSPTSSGSSTSRRCGPCRTTCTAISRCRSRRSPRLAAGRGTRRVPPIRAGLRTGDTPPPKRAALVKRPPHILVTTPESLYLLLTSAEGAGTLRDGRDGHRRRDPRPGPRQARLAPGAVARTARQPSARSRCSASASRPRNGRSERVATRADGFRYGVRSGRRVRTVPHDDCRDRRGHQRDLDLGSRCPRSELGAVCTHEQWAEVERSAVRADPVAPQHADLRQHPADGGAVTHQLTQLSGEDAVSSHHGSLAAPHRDSTPNSD